VYFAGQEEKVEGGGKGGTPASQYSWDLKHALMEKGLPLAHVSGIGLWRVIKYQEGGGRIHGLFE